MAGSVLLTKTVTSVCARWRPKSPTSRLFAQPDIQAQIKENIKAPRHWHLLGEPTGDKWIHKGTRKCFHLMTSSCNNWIIALSHEISCQKYRPVIKKNYSKSLVAEKLILEIMSTVSADVLCWDICRNNVDQIWILEKHRNGTWRVNKRNGTSIISYGLT